TTLPAVLRRRKGLGVAAPRFSDRNAGALVVRENIADWAGNCRRRRAPPRRRPPRTDSRNWYIRDRTRRTAPGDRSPSRRARSRRQARPRWSIVAFLSS